MATNGADCSSHGRRSIPVVELKLPVLEQAEGRPLWHGGGHGLTATLLRDAGGIVGRAAQSVVLLPLG